MKFGDGYKVLIADDEHIICERLKLNLEKDGFEIIGCAENGLKAFNIYNNENPDIIVSDISMPAMNGIELLEKIRNDNGNVKFVFLTGFSEFDYAMSALKNKASDYLLKPLDSDKLSKVMQKVVDEISNDYEIDSMKKENEKLKEGSKIYHYFSEDKIPNKLREDIKEKILNPNGMRMAMIYGNQDNLDSIDNLFLMGNDNHLVFLPKEGSTIDRRFFDSCYCAVGNPCKTQKELKESYLSLRKTLLNRFFYPNQHIFKDKGKTTVDKDKIQAMNQQNTLLLQKGKISELLELIEFELNNLNSPENLEYFMYLTKGLFFRETEKLTGAMINNHSAIWILERFSTLKDLNEWLNTLIIKALSNDNGKHELDLSLRVKKYLDSNYCTSINMETIAVNVFAHPNYISTKFKEDMGITVTEYLCSFRLEKAKHLLYNSNLSCKRISQLVGFQDQFYFCKCFRKKYGITPNSIHKTKSEHS